MSSFETRARLTRQEAQAVIDSTEPSMLSIRHLLDNGDGTFSVMHHINCEWCDYCAEANAGITVHQPKENPYEKEEAASREMDGGTK